ncbi:hypothetical protein Micbo1qcDRAFT_50919 [Microdochium bolleyi]|uniref:PAC domain-containing protein n=1 Tax=Microdochium bolleyi TaxID=196109 RepID=A0A136J6L8_9PEZI|nr:hypothetical protein Micbo1qcDRAFT_50919 [Microdochium bolleyi]
MLRKFSRSFSHLSETTPSPRARDAGSHPRLPSASVSLTAFSDHTATDSVDHRDFGYPSPDREAAEAPDVPRSRSQLSTYDVDSYPARYSSLDRTELPIEPDFSAMDDSFIPDERAHFPVRSESAQSEPYYVSHHVRRPASPEVAQHQGASTRSPSDARKSIMSNMSHAPSSISSFAPGNSALPALQTKGAGNNDGLEPLAEEEIDPASFDLVVPANAPTQYSLEARSELLFSKEHLKVIFEDPTLLQRFTTFLCTANPASVPVLVYYLDALKAMKAVEYVNSITSSLQPLSGFNLSDQPIQKTVNDDLQAKADQAFELLAREDLPAYITQTWVRTVSITIKRRIADTLPVHLRDLSEGLAEVFCLTDPSRPDNPIIFASEEFHRTTQYGMNYVLGRNCRFLQGPKTNPSSVRRLKEKILAGKEHCETFLNYRRDGSPFMNLLMVAPLYDSRGNVRYFIGAQVDVSGLVKECSGLESMERLVQREEAREAEQRGGFDASRADIPAAADTADKDEFRDLAEMFNLTELKTVREHGGSLHRTRQAVQGGDGSDDANLTNWNKPRLLIRDDASIQRRDSDPIMALPGTTGGRLSGIYEHYLLVRPYPNLRILFASPTMRVPGMLQSSFMDRIGGSRHVKDALTQAFADGHGVTAKVRWLSDVRSKRQSQGDKESAAVGKGRWIHCTPLIGGNGAVGVWMVVLVEDEAEASVRRPREAPPVTRQIGHNGHQDQHDLERQSISNGGHGGVQPPRSSHGQAQSQRGYHRRGDETPDMDDISLGGGSFLDAQLAQPRHAQQEQQPSQGDLRQHLTGRRQPARHQYQQQAASSAAASMVSNSAQGSLHHGRSAAVDMSFPTATNGSSNGHSAAAHQRAAANHARLKAALPPMPQGP